MALSTLEPSRTQAQHSVCSHCGHSTDSVRPTRVQTGLSVLAGLVLVLVLLAVSIIGWKLCSDLLSDKISHSIFYHPLEDWTRY